MQSGPPLLSRLHELVPISEVRHCSRRRRRDLPAAVVEIRQGQGLQFGYDRGWTGVSVRAVCKLRRPLQKLSQTWLLWEKQPEMF